jgi:hypothetical protein
VGRNFIDSGELQLHRLAAVQLLVVPLRSVPHVNI